MVLISIVVDPKGGHAKAVATGTMQQAATDKDVNAFCDIFKPSGHDALFKAAQAYAQKEWGGDGGITVTDLWRNNGDLIYIVVAPIGDGQILDNPASPPIIIANQHFDNYSNQPVTCHAHLTTTREDSVTFSWNTGGALTLGQKIAYKFSFWGTGLEGETSLSYEQNWGVGETWTTTVTMESGAAVEVVVPPHGAADACMSADEGTMRVRFKFKQFLSGTFRLAVAWADGRKEQKTAPLEELMVLAGMENCKEVTEDLTLKGYCNKALSVRDGTLTPTQSAAFRSLLMPTAAVGEVA